MFFSTLITYYQDGSTNRSCLQHRDLSTAVAWSERIVDGSFGNGYPATIDISLDSPYGQVVWSSL